MLYEIVHVRHGFASIPSSLELLSGDEHYFLISVMYCYINYILHELFH